MSRSPQLLVQALLLSTMLIGSCARDALPTETPAGEFELTAAVTGAAAEHLHPTTGFFPALDRSAASGDTMSAQRAIQLAAAFLNTFARYQRGRIEFEHGAPIDFGNLRVGARAYFAHSPFEYDGALPAPSRNILGPYYLVHVTSADQVVAVIGIAALASNALVGQDGFVRFSEGWSGNEFVFRGVPASISPAIPVAPEEAVRTVYNTTQTRVVAVPRLILPGMAESGLLWARWLPRWQVELEREIPVTTQAGRKLRVRELFVDAHGQLFAATDDQPAGATFRFLRDDRSQGTVNLRRRSDTPVRFEPVLSTK
jgi:hypothetical protein